VKLNLVIVVSHPCQKIWLKPKLETPNHVEPCLSTFSNHHVSGLYFFHPQQRKYLTWSEKRNQQTMTIHETYHNPRWTTTIHGKQKRNFTFLNRMYQELATLRCRFHHQQRTAYKTTKWTESNNPLDEANYTFLKIMCYYPEPTFTH
jgi:hypothetical protein